MLLLFERISELFIIDFDYKLASVYLSNKQKSKLYAEKYLLLHLDSHDTFYIDEELITIFINFIYLSMSPSPPTSTIISNISMGILFTDDLSSQTTVGLHS